MVLNVGGYSLETKAAIVCELLTGGFFTWAYREKMYGT
jgi:hypothetical protein